MAKNYMGVNLTGRSLMHYRTKGSRNGYSKDPNYRPTGQRATGRLVNGRYVYDTAGSKPANVSQEYWDELQSNTNPNYKPAQKTPKSGINTSIDPRYAKRSTQHGTPYVSEEYKQELAYNTGKTYTPKKNAINVKTDPRFKKQETNTGLKGDPRYSVSGTSKINQANVTALAKKGAKNDWQQMAQIASRTGANGMRRENTGASRSYRTLERVGTMSARTKGDKAMAPVVGVYDMNTGKTKSYTYNVDYGYDRAAKRVRGSNNINSVHNAQTERERSERLRKSQKSAINYTDPSTVSEFFDGVRADPRFNKSTVKGISGMVYDSIDKPKRAAEIADMKAAAAKNSREKHPVKYAINDAKIKASQTAHKAKKETKKLINKGKSTIDSLLKKFKKK